MKNWENEDLLEVVEELAEERGYDIDSELSLSELFDETVAPHVIDQYGEDDTVAMSEEFNNWSDVLCKDGEIHPEQYAQYDYIGKYS